MAPTQTQLPLFLETAMSGKRHPRMPKQETLIDLYEALRRDSSIVPTMTVKQLAERYSAELSVDIAPSTLTTPLAKLGLEAKRLRSRPGEAGKGGKLTPRVVELEERVSKLEEDLEALQSLMAEASRENGQRLRG